ncbi:glutamine amidotransferase/cyclase [Chytriomyces sp. MP71]|nr:glutamine amidotransferase/cyclase [Chytriomyces sp. MP71]
MSLVSFFLFDSTAEGVTLISTVAKRKNTMTVPDGVYMLDYGAGNVRSLINSVRRMGFDIKVIGEAADFDKAERILFPGVGAFGSGMASLRSKGLEAPLRAYLASGRPFMGICIGMQSLFASSEENHGVAGLGLIDFPIARFNDQAKTVPHMGWNAAHSADQNRVSPFVNHYGDDTRYYFVHSYAAIVPEAAFDPAAKKDFLLPGGWSCTLTTYQDQTFISSVQRGNIFATQFHPEKSGSAGLKLLASFLNAETSTFTAETIPTTVPLSRAVAPHRLSRRIIACLDVRTNDAGDLVVTKGDQYDVRETSGDKGVRNLGKPVDLGAAYFEAGADEITFLNITSFRGSVLADDAMLEVVARASERVFVPLTVGGGIRDLVDAATGTVTATALEVAAEYFRKGADKVSIGSDAVYAAEAFYRNGEKGDGRSSIEQISKVYGAQAVVISVDPKRVYVKTVEEARGHAVVEVPEVDAGPNGERLCWYQCTVKGGREARDLDVKQLIVACENLGAGEILCNCMDKDGTNSGFDHALLKLVKDSVKIPVIASSGAGKASHFTDVFRATNVEAALAAGIFHRKEVAISEVKEELRRNGFEARRMDQAL